MLPKRKRQLPKKPPYSKQKLLFDDLQNFHGASLDADAAGDALAGGSILRCDHDLHGADLHALTAGGAQLLVDHVDTGLGILGNGTGLTDLHALTALDADIGLCAGTLGNDTDAGQVLIELLIKCSRASTDALQASHALYIFLNCELLHKRTLLFNFYLHFQYTRYIDKKQPIKINFSNFL